MNANKTMKMIKRESGSSARPKVFRFLKFIAQILIFREENIGLERSKMHSIAFPRKLQKYLGCKI